MKQTIWTGTCAAIITFATAAIFAQTPAQPPAPQSSSPVDLGQEDHRDRLPEGRASDDGRCG